MTELIREQFSTTSKGTRMLYGHSYLKKTLYIDPQFFHQKCQIATYAWSNLEIVDFHSLLLPFALRALLPFSKHVTTLSRIYLGISYHGCKLVCGIKLKKVDLSWPTIFSKHYNPSWIELTFFSNPLNWVDPNFTYLMA